MSSLGFVKNELADDPSTSAEYISKKLGVSRAYAYVLLSKARKELGMRKQPDGKWKLKTRMQSSTPTEEQPPAVIPMPEPTSDNVNHPAHYKTGGIETIDFIEAKNLNYHLGNVVKYVTRADHKGDRLENLKKAQWYLNREIEKSSK